jgi:hypothetical protein
MHVTAPTQADWIEIHTGHGRPAGIYRGNVIVNAEMPMANRIQCL